MPNRRALVGAVFAAIAALLGPQRASADGNLVLYCAVQEEWCRNMVAAFERQTGIKVARRIGTFGLAVLLLVPFPLASPNRFSSSVREPERESCLLYTGHRVASR
jgi:hypothetical protein